MEKKVTIKELVAQSVKQTVQAYDWKKQGTDLVKFGTSGSTGDALGRQTDTWTD